MVAVAHPRPMIAADAAHRFEALFDEHHDVVWRTLRRLGIAAAEVDDATQRVFLVAARRLDEIRIDEERQFLYGIAIRVASEIRRRAPAPQVTSVALLDAIPDSAEDAEAQLIAHEARRALDDALAGMPEELRQVLVLVELEGVPVADIAKLLGVPAGTAASRLRRAREAFAESARRVRARMSREAR